MSQSLGSQIMTNKVILDKYMAIPQPRTCQAMYIWIDGSGENVRAKTKTLAGEPKSLKGMPIVFHAEPEILH